MLVKESFWIGIYPPLVVFCAKGAWKLMSMDYTFYLCVVWVDTLSKTFVSRLIDQLKELCAFQQASD